VPPPQAGADAVGKGRHAIKDGLDFRHHVRAIHGNRGSARRAQGGMQHSAVFSEIDLVTPEHRLNPVAKTAILCQRNEQPNGFVRYPVFRVIQIKAFRLNGQPLTTVRIVGKELAKVPVFDLGVMRGKCVPRGALGQTGISHGLPKIFLRQSRRRSRCRRR